MKFQAAIFSALILSAVGMSLNGCEEEEDHQIYRVLKNANCKLSPHIEKIKSGMGSIRDKFLGKINGVRGLFNKEKTNEEFDFDEIDVSEEIITMRGKREENDEENGEVQENETEKKEENQISEETSTTEGSPDYLVPQPYNILRAPSKCAEGKKNVDGRCRTIYS